VKSASIALRSPKLLLTRPIKNGPSCGANAVEKLLSRARAWSQGLGLCDRLRQEVARPSDCFSASGESKSEQDGGKDGRGGSSEKSSSETQIVSRIEFRIEGFAAEPMANPRGRFQPQPESPKGAWGAANRSVPGDAHWRRHHWRSLPIIVMRETQI